MNLKKQYETSPTVACFYGFGGIEIKAILYGIDDYVVFAAGTMCQKSTFHKAKIYYSERGDYFKFKGSKIYLNECLKV